MGLLCACLDEMIFKHSRVSVSKIACAAISVLVSEKQKDTASNQIACNGITYIFSLNFYRLNILH